MVVSARPHTTISGETTGFRNFPLRRRATLVYIRHAARQGPYPFPEVSGSLVTNVARFLHHATLINIARL